MKQKTRFLNSLYRRTIDIYEQKVKYLSRSIFKNFSYDLVNNKVDIETLNNTYTTSGVPINNEYNELFPDGNDYIIDDDPTKTFTLNNESDSALDNTFFAAATDYDEEGSQYTGVYSNSTNTIINGVTYNKPDYSRTFYLIKTDKNGDYVWVKDFNLKSTGSSISRINSIVCDKNGNVFIGGYFGGKIGDEHINVTRTPVQAEAFLMKLDYDGNIKWINDVYYDNGSSYTEVVATTTGDNHVYVTIYFGYTVNDFHIGGKTIDLSSIENTTMNRSGMIIKLDYDGNYVKHKVFDTNDTVYLTNMYFNHSNLYVTGYLKGDGYFGTTSNPIDITNTGTSLLLIKMGMGCEPIFVKSENITGATGRYSDVVVDSDENIYVNGYFIGDTTIGGNTYSASALNAIVVKYDSDGNVGWSYYTSNTGENLGYGIDIVNNNIALFNEYRGASNFEIDNKITSQTITNSYSTAVFNALIILDKNTGEYADKFTYLFPTQVISGLTFAFDPDNNIYISSYNIDTNQNINLTIGVDTRTYTVDGYLSPTYGKICSKALNI